MILLVGPGLHSLLHAIRDQVCPEAIDALCQRMRKSCSEFSIRCGGMRYSAHQAAADLFGDMLSFASYLALTQEMVFKLIEIATEIAEAELTQEDVEQLRQKIQAAGFIRPAELAV